MGSPRRSKARGSCPARRRPNTRVKLSAPVPHVSGGLVDIRYASIPFVNLHVRHRSLRAFR